MNVISINGNLGQDPEMKYFESGKVKTTFSVAVEGYRNKAKTTNWFRVECWDKEAELAGEYLKKGKPVSVTGRLQSSEKDGKTYWTLVCEKLNFGSQSLVVIYGKVENLETRYTENNIQIRSFIIDGIKAELFGDKTVFTEGQEIVASGSIEMVDFQPVLQVKKVF